MMLTSSCMLNQSSVQASTRLAPLSSNRTSQASPG
jgi:hypothetical protein